MKSFIRRQREFFFPTRVSETADHRRKRIMMIAAVAATTAIIAAFWISALPSQLRFDGFLDSETMARWRTIRSSSKLDERLDLGVRQIKSQLKAYELQREQKRAPLLTAADVERLKAKIEAAELISMPADQADNLPASSYR